jgi:hypothetical protein
MGVPLKTEQRRSHTPVSSFRPWVRRAEKGWRFCQRKFCMEVPVKPHRPPSLPLVCVVFPDHSSFSVLRGTPMASAKNTQFQKAKVLRILFSLPPSILRSRFRSEPSAVCPCKCRIQGLSRDPHRAGTRRRSLQSACRNHTHGP